MAAGATALFTYTASAAAVAAGGGVRLIVSPSAGDPGLYVSNSTAPGAAPGPGSNSNLWSSATPGPELITVLASDPSFPAALNFTLAVFGYGAAGGAAAQGTVLAQGAGGTITLLPGYEQAQLVPPHGMALFALPVGTFAPAGANAEFDVVATPLSGDVDAYVSVSGVAPAAVCAAPAAPPVPGNCSEWTVAPTTYNYSSAAAAVSGVGGFVAVPGAALAPATPLVVGVLGTSPDGYFLAPPSLFTVVAQSASAPLRLNNGVPVAGVVTAGAVRRYNFTFYAAASDVVIAAEFSAGALDLYASATVPAPGPGASTWNTSTTGGFIGRRRVLYIAGAALAAACPAAATAGCTIWLAAVGSANMVPSVQCAFTVSATVSGNPAQPAPLVQGVQVLAEIPPNAAAYYSTQVNVDPSQALYVMATDVSAGGALTLLASLGPNAAPPSAANGWAANYTSTDIGGYSRLMIAPGGYGGYCSACPMFITLRSQAQARSDVGLLFLAGPAFVPLTDGQVTPTIIPANGSALLSFGVSDPLADIVFSFNEIAGPIIAYIGVVSPARPYRVPSIQFHQYAVLPSAGTSSLTIGKGDPAKCVSTDGSQAGVPCTYVIGVYPLDPNAGETLFSVVATADATNGLIQLVDSIQTDGSVAEGQLSYYFVTPGAGVAPIIISAAAYSGAVKVFVTNAYIPGQSASGLLPGPNTGCAAWSSVDRTPVVISSTDACFSPLLGTYTIGVMGAAGVPGYITPFYISAAFNQPYQALKLELGVPVTNVWVPKFTNAYFTFDLPTTDNDLVVSASPLYGSVSTAVSKHGFAAAAAPPSCSSTGGSVAAYCGGYAWLATGTAGASTMRVPAASPCSPATGNGLPPPWANTTAVVGPGGVSRPACQAAWYPGRFWLVIFAWTDAVVTVSVQVRARARAAAAASSRVRQPRARHRPPRAPLPALLDRWQAHAAVRRPAAARADGAGDLVRQPQPADGQLPAQHDGAAQHLLRRKRHVPALPGAGRAQRQRSELAHRAHLPQRPRRQLRPARVGVRALVRADADARPHDVRRRRRLCVAAALRLEHARVPNAGRRAVPVVLRRWRAGLGRLPVLGGHFRRLLAAARRRPLHRRARARDVGRRHDAPNAVARLHKRPELLHAAPRRHWPAGGVRRPPLRVVRQPEYPDFRRLGQYCCLGVHRRCRRLPLHEQLQQQVQPCGPALC